MAKELGMDLAAVRGTGPGGRITVEDVEKAKALREVSQSAHDKTPNSETH